MKFLFLLISSIILAGCSLPFLPQDQAAIQVNSEPSASVYLNGNHVGQTPYYDENLKPGEYSLKVQLDQDPSKYWETPITLNPKLVTVASRRFGDLLENSSSYIIRLEELPDPNAVEISIITIPDNVIVKINNQPEGFSPIVLKSLTPGEHGLSLVAPGYSEEIINLSVQPGYKMLISANLAKTQALLKPDITPVASVSASPVSTPSGTPAAGTPTPSAPASSSGTLTKPYVTITDTGTGWLRVRSAPNANTDNEVARVDVGDSFPFLDSNETGWYQIQYAPGKSGWISGQFADLFD